MQGIVRWITGTMAFSRFEGTDRMVLQKRRDRDRELAKGNCRTYRRLSFRSSRDQELAILLFRIGEQVLPESPHLFLDFVSFLGVLPVGYLSGSSVASPSCFVMTGTFSIATRSLPQRSYIPAARKHSDLVTITLFLFMLFSALDVILGGGIRGGIRGRNG